MVLFLSFFWFICKMGYEYSDFIGLLLGLIAVIFLRVLVVIFDIGEVFFSWL